MDEKKMTVRRRIFLINTAMVLTTLLLFLLINLIVVKIYAESVEEELMVSIENAQEIEGGLDELVEGWTIHREQFLLIFGIDGILCIAVLLLVSQIFTGRLVNHIKIPLDALEEGARRIQENNLTEEILYQGDVEFETVCRSFNEMQKHLLEEQEKNRRYEKARTDMIAGISHDLRTPLTAVRASIKGVLDGVAEEPELRKKFLTTAYKRTGDMAGLLNQLFYFSRMETGNVPLNLEKIELVSFLQNYVEDKKALSYPEEVQFEENLLEGEAWTLLDVEQFYRILDNLLENSLKYAGVSPIKITISLKRSKDGVQLCFGDNGAGIGKEKLPYVFEEFYRGDESRNKKEGNGLGLYIVKYLVQAMGGKVHAESENGFQVVLDFPVNEK